jgi:hypothetical protein
MLRLVQLRQQNIRRIAVVQEPRLRLLRGHDSVHALAQAALASGRSLRELVAQLATEETLDYEAVYGGAASWRLLTPIDHPDEPARCLVSGTGLTHLGSAKDRSAMHLAATDQLTDSMRMFQWGLQGGRPAPGQAGVAPEWFYKGGGSILRTIGEPLEVPAYAEDGGEEAEAAGIYLIDAGGHPHRLGLVVGNEFSDHVFEKKNYLNLAGSKIRTCAIGPELVVAPDFSGSVPGRVAIERAGRVVWEKAIATGEAEMSHSLANLEHHHFKFESHRRPGDLHVHFYGAHSLSFGAGVKVADGDVMTVSFEGFGRPLRNPLRLTAPSTAAVPVSVMT